MNITEKLYYGIELDIKKPLTEEIKEAFYCLLGNNEDFCFSYEEYVWNYWSGSDGFFDSKKGRYNKGIEKKIDTYKKKYKNYIELEYEADAFYNIGSQVVSCENDGKLYIRIIPYGIEHDNKMLLKISEYAYYIVYDISTKEVNLGFLHIDDEIYHVNEPITKEEQQHCLENGEDFDIDNESMEFGYDFGIEDPVKKVYSILNQYEPNISPWIFSNYILIELYTIKKQIKYPIFSNEEARRRILDLQHKYPDDLKEEGFFPNKYNINEFLGIDNYPNESIQLEYVKYVREWNDIIIKYDLKECVEYYKEIKGMTIGIDEMYKFVEIFNKVDETPDKIVKFILRGVSEENLNLNEILSKIKELITERFIDSWNGKFSMSLINKKEMSTYTLLSREVLNALEKTPTLDNMYKLLIENS